jgi:hypothetical protein
VIEEPSSAFSLFHTMRLLERVPVGYFKPRCPLVGGRALSDGLGGKRQLEHQATAMF